MFFIAAYKEAPGRPYCWMCPTTSASGKADNKRLIANLITVVLLMCLWSTSGRTQFYGPRCAGPESEPTLRPVINTGPHIITLPYTLWFGATVQWYQHGHEPQLQEITVLSLNHNHTEHYESCRRLRWSSFWLYASFPPWLINPHPHNSY